MQTVEINSGNQHSRSANRNCETNSPPYGYGGLSAETIVLPVRIIMSPISSSRFLAGMNARSATLRTISTNPSSGCGQTRIELYAMQTRRGAAPGRRPAILHASAAGNVARS